MKTLAPPCIRHPVLQGLCRAVNLAWALSTGVLMQMWCYSWAAVWTHPASSASGVREGLSLMCSTVLCKALLLPPN